jgi:hypothetical protein
MAMRAMGLSLSCCDALLELALTNLDFSEFLQLLLVEIFNKNAVAALQANHIHGQALNRVIHNNLLGPPAELHRVLAFALETRGNNGLQTETTNPTFNFSLAIDLKQSPA